MAEVFDLMELEPNIPSQDFGSYCTHLSAPPKFGKSEWCTQFDKPLILDFEEGTKGKVVYRVPIENWSHFKKYTKQLTKNEALKTKYKTICIDTVNYALEFCKKYLVAEYQTNHPEKLIDTFNKIPFGGGWELLTKEFKEVINSLKRAGYGVVMVSHIKDKVIDRDSEQERTKTVPDLSDKERNMISAMADFLLLGEFEEETIEPAERDKTGKIVKEAIIETKRVLYLRTTGQVEAGFRWSNCPEKIPFDYDLLNEIFDKAVAEEISKGKAKFGISDDKAEEIREKLDEIAEEQMKEVFAEKIEDYITDIKALMSDKRKEGVKVKVIREALESLKIDISEIDELQDISTAKEVIEVLNSLK